MRSRGWRTDFIGMEERHDQLATDSRKLQRYALTHTYLPTYLPSPTYIFTPCLPIYPLPTYLPFTYLPAPLLPTLPCSTTTPTSPSYPLLPSVTGIRERSLCNIHVSIWQSNVPNKFEIKVRRNSILEDSYRIISSVSRLDLLKTKLWVEFESEVGLGESQWRAVG